MSIKSGSKPHGAGISSSSGDSWSYLVSRIPHAITLLSDCYCMCSTQVPFNSERDGLSRTSSQPPSSCWSSAQDVRSGRADQENGSCLPLGNLFFNMTTQNAATPAYWRERWEVRTALMLFLPSPKIYALRPERPERCGAWKLVVRWELRAALRPETLKRLSLPLSGHQLYQQCLRPD